MKDFEGLTALVTGGASGIGADTARLLHRRGARVAVLDRDVTAVGAEFLALTCDVGERAAIEAAVAEVADRCGGLDIVVANAGIGAVGDVAANDDAEWSRVLDVNVTGIARVVSAALPHLRRSTCAAVVTTCSAVAFVGVRHRALYSASKGAVHALTIAMAADHADAGIRVNAVAPGTADTPWITRLLESAEDPAAAAESLRQRQPSGRLVTSDEVAEALAFLASPISGSTTGTVLRVDGGMTTLRL
ncbi:SDR family oxidoreductase [Pseudonocardia nematodicida]|uniref:SDR family oxidoreductase n=1 Tax=Pseudonocardia nematodicida TaxID=1206997 RepID=A0ABV1KFJ0_9PSEU